MPKLKVNFPYQTLTVVQGEACKSMQTCMDLWIELAEKGATRKSLLICLGGGSLCDLGGFVATTYQRGMKLCFLPTTLLCMVDAGIGGKNGINLNGLKNYIGTFRLPETVLIYPDWLITLPEEEWYNGKAEIIKHALLSENHWNPIQQHGFPEKDDLDSWSVIIKDNFCFKESIITADFTENNIRAQLNFGHTAAHAMEYLYAVKGNALAHGLAVAAGMMIETHAALKMRLCSAELYASVKSVVLSLFDKVEYSEEDIETLNRAAMKDKKSGNGDIVCSVISEIGHPIEPKVIPKNIMTEAWQDYIHETV
jgi:3-dehydroquinate synthase